MINFIWIFGVVSLNFHPAVHLSQTDKNLKLHFTQKVKITNSRQVFFHPGSMSRRN
jgi:hypothetical protein